MMPSLIRRTGLAVLTIILILRCQSLSARQEGESVTEELLVSQIRDLWKERYQKFHSVALTIEEKVTYHPGHSFVRADSRHVQEQDDDGVTEDNATSGTGKVYHRKCAMLMDGVKVLVAENGPRFQLDFGEFRHYVDRRAFDSTTTRSLLIDKEEEYPVQGFLSPGKGFLLEPEEITKKPLRVWLAPLFGSEIKLQPADERIHGDPLPEGLVEVKDEAGNRIWLDPALDYAPIRFIDRLLPQSWVVQVSYKKHDSGMWVPTRWTTELDGRWGKMTIEKELSEFRINPFIPDCVFKPDMPVGTLVVDFRSGARETYVVGFEGQKTTPDAGFIKSLYDQQLLPPAVYDKR